MVPNERRPVLERDGGVLAGHARRLQHDLDVPSAYEDVPRWW